MGGRGPARKDQSVRARRNAPRANTLLLPAEGRKGDPPGWPLASDREWRVALDQAETECALLEDELARADGEEKPAIRRDYRRAVARREVAHNDLEISEAEELKLWAILWALPQAVAWERIGYLNEVAQYVRWKVRAELGDLQASKESRQLADDIGLTPAAMTYLHWEVVADELGEKREEAVAVAAAAPAKRARAKSAATKAVDPRASLKLV